MLTENNFPMEIYHRIGIKMDNNVRFRTLFFMKIGERKIRRSPSGMNQQLSSDAGLTLGTLRNTIGKKTFSITLRTAAKQAAGYLSSCRGPGYWLYDPNGNFITPIVGLY
ncbi:hypothetical protein [Glaciimonas immobilis]|uniref:Uncharacterized protein n=1 Tax=Glaciimonas immobilis TaxID=728004 RepID=A0A840RV84_9BURK|nr:hypothetical protein [Glaciimonas immobilis]KAF3999987.1 hypothetical protein HAV38_02080 [Glaciimonas immobilis]MBB5200491.1 hypothetical protein [Glaciimonas immobilis]